MKLEFLDCTLRDGGYYTNWDFERGVVKRYLTSFDSLPVDYIEIGYRNPKKEGYFGEYFYCPSNTLEFVKENSNKSLAIILNEKDVGLESAQELMLPCEGIIDLVRIAVDPENIERAIKLAEKLKKIGFRVAFNVMYMSRWGEYSGFLKSLHKLDGVIDYFYLVDSFGGVYPSDVRDVIQMVKSETNVPLGFHGHNNLELGLVNTLTAIDEGVQIVDATMTGMGRGAGNLKSELLLTVLNQKYGVDIDFNALSEVTSDFSQLQKQYDWGTSLPYMVSGANSLPQKQVMEWVGKRYYSINSIIRALDNHKKGQKDNEQYQVFYAQKTFKKALIIGGGESVLRHYEAINKYCENNAEDLVIIHSSSRNALSFKSVQNDQIFCLVGNEGVRLERTFQEFDTVNGQYILPPYPRVMGTYVPEKIKSSTKELEEVVFTEDLKDTHTSLALQVALDVKASEVILIGYDGYEGEDLSQREMELLEENNRLFRSFHSFTDVQLCSLTPTRYKELVKSSVFKEI